MDQITIHIEADINPTESPEKIQKAIWNLFGETPTQTGNTLTAEAKTQEPLATLRNILRRDQIRDAARKALLTGKRGNTITVYLNKQVAYAGHASFCQETGESPLGPIRITIQTDNPEELITWLAPRTGKPRA